MFSTLRGLAGLAGLATLTLALAAGTVDYAMPQAGFPCPTFGLNPATQITWQPVYNQIKEKSTIEPDGCALAAYDALRVAALAHGDAGPAPTATALKAAFVARANGDTGLTGSTKLDAAGDRVAANYDFFGLKAGNGGHTWEVVGRDIDGKASRP